MILSLQNLSKERPILFSGPMVRAILDGRKTQTRRVIKPQPLHPQVSKSDGYPGTWYGHGQLGIEPEVWSCPYGVPGDRLWVRESVCLDWRESPVYKADDPDGNGAREAGYSSEPKYKPSIHMPRWASRITLEISDVRVQRLQEISREDALAEGMEGGCGPGYDCAQHAFMMLWDDINCDKYPWASNPWVWALTFRRSE
jgi:hypothetical protein